MRQQHLIDISQEFEGTYSIGTAIDHEAGVVFTEPAKEDLPPWSSDWLVVVSNASTGERDLVYNFRVNEWHTYFVGSDHWGFSLWVHNNHSGGKGGGGKGGDKSGPGKNDSAGGKEHTAGARPSTKGKHQKGQAAKKRSRGGEKGDKQREAPRRRPDGWKGPWPPKSGN